MLTIASIMLALSVLTTSPAICKPYISVPTECGIVEEYRECEVVGSRYDGSRSMYVVTVKTADRQLWDMLDGEDYWRKGDRLVACFDRYEDTGVVELNTACTYKY